MDLNNFLVNPLTLILIILGVVEMVKKLGVSGNKLMFISMAVGFGLAMLYKLRELYEPSSVYVEVIFFGIAAGLGASGIYSFINARFPAQTNRTMSSSQMMLFGESNKIEPPGQEVQ